MQHAASTSRPLPVTFNGFPKANRKMGPPDTIHRTFALCRARRAPVRIAGVAYGKRFLEPQSEEQTAGDFQ
jgi:hypothetical protein